MTPRDPVSMILAAHDAELEFAAIREQFPADDEYTPTDDDRAVAILAADIGEVIR